MKRNVSFFIPHLGCKHSCSFCNQVTISGHKEAVTTNDMEQTLNECIKCYGTDELGEICFFGGSFTAIDKGYMLNLLQMANKFIDMGFKGIRISTRPDCVEADILDILKQYNVTAIELGAQSMRDSILEKNSRGHTAECVRCASKRIKAYGFELGLQMMTGLYGDSMADSIYTADEIIKLAPKAVRIYPTVILDGTALAKLYKSGEYKPIDFYDTVELCATLLQKFLLNNISVIKLGLHASSDVEDSIIGGVYHPAFRELVESRIYYKLAMVALKTSDTVIQVKNECLSKMIGQKKENIIRLHNNGYNVKIEGVKGLKEFEIHCY